MGITGMAYLPRIYSHFYRKPSLLGLQVQIKRLVGFQAESESYASLKNLPG
jgi:hypothetical protein